MCLTMPDAAEKVGILESLATVGLGENITRGVGDAGAAVCQWRLTAVGSNLVRVCEVVRSERGDQLLGKTLRV